MFLLILYIGFNLTVREAGECQQTELCQPSQYKAGRTGCTARTIPGHRLVQVHIHAWDNWCNPLPAPQTLQRASLEEIQCAHTVDLFCVLCSNNQLCQAAMQI